MLTLEEGAVCTPGRYLTSWLRHLPQTLRARGPVASDSHSASKEYR
jgi:hypothetical protein